MKIRLKFAVSIAVLIIFLSCSDDQEKVEPSFYQMLTGSSKKVWRMTSLQWTGEGKSPLTFSIPNCIRDDMYIFYANEERLFEVDNGPTKCDNNEDQIVISDVWSLNSATATLTLIFPLLSDNPLPFTIRSLKIDEMVFDIYIDNEQNYTYKISMVSVSEE